VVDASWQGKGIGSRLMERTLALMGQVGNDVVHVPILLSGVGGKGKSGTRFNWQPIVRWVKTPQGLRPDFTILEKYLEIKNMVKVGEAVNRSSGTVHTHIANHNREVRALGSCSRCKRRNHKLQDQIIDITH